MLKICKCGKEFITEAGPLAWVYDGEWKENCGCYFTEPLIKKLNITVEALKDITEELTPSWQGERALKALKEINE